jgi:hypothetical protein
MKLTQEQHEQIVFYLQHLDIDSQELFEEFYDHIVSSFEKHLKVNPDLSLKSHIWDYLQPEFGGVGGFKDVIKRHKKTIAWNVSKRIVITALSAFKGKNLLYSAAVFLSIWGLMATSKNLSILVGLIIACFCLPMAIAIKKHYQFKKSVRENNPGYYQNLRNAGMMQVCTLSLYLLYNLGHLVYRSLENHPRFSHLYTEVPMFQAALIGLAGLHCYTMLTVMKHDFKTKLLTT